MSWWKRWISTMKRYIFCKTKIEHVPTIYPISWAIKKVQPTRIKMFWVFFGFGSISVLAIALKFKYCYCLNLGPVRFRNRTENIYIMFPPSSKVIPIGALNQTNLVATSFSVLPPSKVVATCSPHNHISTRPNKYDTFCHMTMTIVVPTQPLNDPNLHNKASYFHRYY